MLCAWPYVACVASVSVWFRSKKRPWKGSFGLIAREIKQEPKNKRWGRGKGRKEQLMTASNVGAWTVRHGQAKWAVFKIEGFMVVYLQAFPPFLPHPFPALLLTPFIARSLTLVPRSFLLNRTETLATQASLAMGSLRGRCKKGRGRGEGETPSLSLPRPPSLFPSSLSATRFDAG